MNGSLGPWRHLSVRLLLVMLLPLIAVWPRPLLITEVTLFVPLVAEAASWHCAESEPSSELYRTRAERTTAPGVRLAKLLPPSAPPPTASVR
jgi:hypothetical protein